MWQDFWEGLGGLLVVVSFVMISLSLDDGKAMAWWALVLIAGVILVAAV